jgi:hypothetical protein
LTHDLSLKDAGRRRFDQWGQGLGRGGNAGREGADLANLGCVPLKRCIAKTVHWTLGDFDMSQQRLLWFARTCHQEPLGKSRFRGTGTPPGKPHAHAPPRNRGSDGRAIALDRPTPARGDRLSWPAHQARRALSGGRHHRSAGPADRRPAQKRLGRHRGCREQAGRGNHATGRSTSSCPTIP